MLDFLSISTRTSKRGVEIYPNFIIDESSDLMIRGRDFYAIWVEERGQWSTKENDALRLIDKELDAYAVSYKHTHEGTSYVLHMRDAASGMIDNWHKYCQKQCRDSFKMLDEKLVFSNDAVNKKDYSSKRLPYPLEKGSIEAYDHIMSVLYSEEERHKIEWAIGSIVSGDSKKIQKFLVLYGAAGTGKSTVLNIVQQLFAGYYAVFDAKALGSSNNSFALESFNSNPLVAIQHDGDLSRIEDNTRLNSLVSHETMTVNEKFKSTYANAFKSFLFMGTNKPVKITDGKSGLLRRLIDVSPTGEKLSLHDYHTFTKQIEFELGAIAYHCKEVYLSDPGKYDDYVPVTMLGASNDFYNYMIDSYHVFLKEDGTTLKTAWEMYKTYCDEAKVAYPYSQRNFKEELKNYFHDFKERSVADDGSRLRSYYTGFRTEKFETEKKPEGKNGGNNTNRYVIAFSEGRYSIFDVFSANCPAQYATDEGIPSRKWTDVTTKLVDLDTSRLHYVKVPENHIVIDFDIKGPDGEKSFEKNLEAASKWPATYAELSKSGAGIHLHYIYSGDPSKLSRVYDENVEIKVFTGNSSLRRKLTKCNDKPIAQISSGLPLKEESRVINNDAVQSEKGLRTTIKKCLCKEVHAGTKSNIDFINKLLTDYYNSGSSFDVSDMKNDILAFAANSTNQSDYCIKLVAKMPFKSDEPSISVDADSDELVFFDCEVFPNLFLVNWKIAGEGKPIVRMVNPKPKDIEDLSRFNLIGFNCRRYDNHILYACMLGYTNEQLYNLSQKIINSKKGDRGILFGEAYNLSYTDIYDFASAGNKKSLKKLEIEMGIHHQELGLPWDQPVPEEMWPTVAEYCDNDVIATEAAFNYLKGDWTARQILADIAGMSVNDTTNSLSTRIIFGKNKKPQDQFNYRDLSKPVGSEQYEEYRMKFGEDYIFRVFDDKGLPRYETFIPAAGLPDGYSILPFFPGYKYEYGKSTYLGQEIGEGGRVYAEPGMYGGVWDGDVTGMHPSSIIAEVLFGPKYTKAFKEIVDGRVSIKHKAWDDIDELFDGKLKPYIQKVIDGALTVKELANALKTVVNSVYGLTSAAFENPFRDKRNVDNIVAKRGALFMTLLTSEVQKRGFTVCHNKTDSIKIPDATDEIREFVLKFGHEYGYSFETEAEFDKFCLVNDAVYIAKTKEGEWEATGKQFAVPYVFKTLFSKEPIEFNDMCETFSVSKGDLYLDMNENLPDVSSLEKDLDKIVKNAKKFGVEMDLSGNSGDAELDPMIHKIAAGHDMKFVGRIGQFTPVRPGYGGGTLYRVNDGKKYAAPGSSGYRWLESEMIKGSNESFIDVSFYDKLVDDAISTIKKYGDFDLFVSDQPYAKPILNEPPWGAPCGKDSCLGCTDFQHIDFPFECRQGYDISDINSLYEDPSNGAFEKR